MVKRLTQGLWKSTKSVTASLNEGTWDVSTGSLVETTVADITCHLTCPLTCSYATWVSGLIYLVSSPPSPLFKLLTLCWVSSVHSKTMRSQSLPKAHFYSNQMHRSWLWHTDLPRVVLAKNPQVPGPTQKRVWVLGGSQWESRWASPNLEGQRCDREPPIFSPL